MARAPLRRDTAGSLHKFVWLPQISIGLTVMPRATSRGPEARVKPIMLVGSAVRSGIQACQTFLPPRNVDHASAGFIGYMRTSLVTSYNYSLGQQFYTPLNHRHLRSCLSRNRGFVYKDMDAAPCLFLSRRISFYISFLLRTSICEKIFNPDALKSATGFK